MCGCPVTVWAWGWRGKSQHAHWETAQRCLCVSIPCCSGDVNPAAARVNRETKKTQSELRMHQNQPLQQSSVTRPWELLQVIWLFFWCCINAVLTGDYSGEKTSSQLNQWNTWRLEMCIRQLRLRSSLRPLRLSPSGKITQSLVQQTASVKNIKLSKQASLPVVLCQAR